MSTSPFFSGRIPQELYNKAGEHCKETGKSRTDLLIEALSTYLNFPVRTQTTSFVPQPIKVTKEMFELLQQQVNKHERLITQIQLHVITQHDDRSNSTITLPDNIVIINDNNDGSSTATNVDNTNHSADNNVIVNDNRNDKLESKITDNDITPSDNSSDNVDSTVIIVDNDNNDKSESETIDNTPSVSDNGDDNADNQGIITQEHSVFQSITSDIVLEKTGLKKNQLISLRQKVTKKYKKEQKALTPKTMLERPEEIKTDIVITIDNTNYQLLYLGQNLKGKNLWSLIPSDNSRYQPIATEFDYTTTNHNK